jgi:hypothetical protein
MKNNNLSSKKLVNCSLLIITSVIAFVKENLVHKNGFSQRHRGLSRDASFLQYHIFLTNKTIRLYVKYNKPLFLDTYASGFVNKTIIVGKPTNTSIPITNTTGRRFFDNLTHIEF